MPISEEDFDETDEAFKAYKSPFKTMVAPFDARFPHHNQFEKCRRYYIDFHRCRHFKGKDYPPCYFFREAYLASCPAAPVKKWNELLKKGALPWRVDR